MDGTIPRSCCELLANKEWINITAYLRNSFFRLSFVPFLSTFTKESSYWSCHCGYQTNCSLNLESFSSNDDFEHEAKLWVIKSKQMALYLWGGCLKEFQGPSRLCFHYSPANREVANCRQLIGQLMFHWVICRSQKPRFFCCKSASWKSRF